MPTILKEITVLIIGKPSLQEDVAPELEVTPTAVEPEVAITEESLTRENMAPETETTLSNAGLEVVTHAVPVIDPRCLLSTCLREKFRFPISRSLRKVILERNCLLSYLVGGLLNLIFS